MSSSPWAPRYWPAATALAADGYRVILHYGSQRERTEGVAASIREAGGSADVVGADLSQPEAAFQLAAEVALEELPPDWWETATELEKEAAKARNREWMRERLAALKGGTK